MNTFHLHLSDREGFRIQSDTHPEVPTAPYLTKAEIANLVAFARDYHVTLIPEIDSPGHLTAALRNHPELWQGGTNASQLDISIDASYAFIEDLLRELIPLFPGQYWHIGVAPPPTVNTCRSTGGTARPGEPGAPLMFGVPVQPLRQHRAVP